MSEAPRHHVVLTGFPGNLLARRVLRHLLECGEVERVRCIVPARFAERARHELEGLPETQRLRVTLLEGDVTHVDMGLSGIEWRRLTAETTRIHHCAHVAYFGADRKLAERVNVQGTCEALELARHCERLERLVHWSTALVSGRRQGRVLEEDLQRPAGGFRNAIEESRFRAEQLVRAARDELPVVVLRPSIVTGDSRTGETDRVDGPFLLALLLLSLPRDVGLPLPGSGEIPLNLVPIDFVVEAGCRLAADPRAVGRTFHLVDPDPPTVRQVFELLSAAAGRPAPRGNVSPALATALMRLPGVGRLAGVPRAFLEQLALPVVWDDRGAREILEAQGLRCPPFASYAARIVAFARRHREARRARRVQPELFSREVELDEMG